MRVLFLSPGLGMGGSERLTLRYATGLRDRGHGVAIAHGVPPSGANELARAAADAGVEALQVSDAALDYRSLWSWSRELARAARHFGPDVLHAQSVTSALAGRMATPCTPLLVTLHGLEREDRERIAAVALSATAARLTGVSKQAAENVARYWPRPSIEVLPTGIDLDELASSAASAKVERLGSPAFCCVARQEPIKGVDVLIEAFAQARKALPDAGLTLVGSGSALADNRVLSQRLGLADRVRFTGTVPNAEPYIAAADIAVLPSRREGLPVTALEALGLGRPMIASAVGGTPTVVRDGETGWLVPPEDPRALTEALVRAGSDRTEARRRGQAGRELLRRDYPPEALFDRLELILAEAALARERDSRAVTALRRKRRDG